MRFATVLLLALATACASSKVDIVRPSVQIVEISGPSDQYSPRGVNRMEAQYGFVITNRANVPITLRHIRLVSVGEGAYYMRPEDRSFQQVIGPGETGQVAMYALVYYQVGPLGDASAEPVSVRATLSFESPKGRFQQMAMQTLSQFPSR